MSASGRAATSAGLVAGVDAHGVVSFKGVPYGASTGGSNRFRPPQPVEPWGGVLDASSYSDACPQPSMLGELPADVERLIEYALVAGDRFGEDCLTVNVWTPAADDSGRPVMVWFHGGGQTIGSGNMPIYDGSNLARVGDTVVVTVNHRLGVLGYLSLTESTGPEYLTSGNAGLLDMIASLRWVRENIAVFGGDPGNVTIFGQSGGGPKVSALLAAPAAVGLFHQAIIQSGPGLRAVDASSAATTSAAILERLGSPTDRRVGRPPRGPSAGRAGRRARWRVCRPGRIASARLWTAACFPYTPSIRLPPRPRPRCHSSSGRPATR